MTSPSIPGERGRRLAGQPRSSGIERCLNSLEDAVGAAEALGLDASAAIAVRDEARQRLGLVSDAYVLALVGGTGVGKSSLLNALAGATVSEAGARRPTTHRPVAWMATSAAPRVGPLLDRLGAGDRRVHDIEALEGVVILDLPDVDSLEPANRATVEQILPRADAVAWVTDPEKYADALLHDGFLRRWIPRLDRQVVVLNKADLLDEGGADQIRSHLATVLGAELAGSASSRPEILLVSARHGGDGVASFRAWLSAAIDAKAVVAGRLAAATVDAVESLARAAGAWGPVGLRPLIDPERRRRAVDASVAEVLRVVDLRGAERQAVAATRAGARPRGAGPLGHLTSFVYRTSGRERRVADPAAYLSGWRSRGGMTRAAAPVREAVQEALPAAPSILRPGLAAAAEPGLLEGRLAGALDRAVAAQPDIRAPTSALWSLLGLAQTANLALLVFAVAWMILWVVARPPVDVVDLPLIGPLPMPFALLALGLASGFVLARLLSLHAGLLGRRWARRLADRVRAGLEAAVADEAFGAVDRVEVARRALWIAAREAETAAGSPSGGR
ncbi:MAG TPA: GTPase [Candidatus Limnocylindrales bacterium]